MILSLHSVCAEPKIQYFEEKSSTFQKVHFQKVQKEEVNNGQCLENKLIKLALLLESSLPKFFNKTRCQHP